MSWGGSNYTRKLKSSKKEDIDKNLLSAQLANNYSFNRGYSFYPDSQQQIIDLFKPFEDEIESRVGFRISKYKEYIDAIIEYYRCNLSILIYMYASGIDDLNKFNIENLLEEIKCYDSEKKNIFTDNIMKYYVNNLYSGNTISVVFDKLFFDPKSIIDILKGIEIEEFEAFIKRFSIPLNGNEDGKFKYPSDENIFRRRPILNYNGKYMIPNISSIYWCIQGELEDELQKNKKLYDRYTRHKGKYLENESIEVFKNLIPEAIIYTNLLYTSLDGKECELDALIQYDNFIILLEAKSGKIHESVKRGSLLKLETSMRNIIDEATDQAIRTMNYIEENTVLQFMDKDNNQVIQIQKKENQKIFLINVSLENFFDLSLELKKIYSIGIIKNKVLPWSVSLNDLKIISDFIEFPLQFLHYISIRTRVNNSGSYEPVLGLTFELDFFAYYLLEDKSHLINKYSEITIDDRKYFKSLFLGDVSKNNTKSMESVVMDFTKIYNDFYNNNSPIIRKEYSKEFRNLISELENLNVSNKAIVALILLDLNLENQQYLIELIRQIEIKTKEDKLGHDLTLPLLFNRYDQKIKYGITIKSCYSKDKIEAFEKLITYCKLRKYDTKSIQWLGMLNVVDDNSNIINDYCYLEGQYEYDTDMEKLMAQARADGIKVIKAGRNDLCPCGSGKKYKRCHGGI